MRFLIAIGSPLILIILSASTMAPRSVQAGDATRISLDGSWQFRLDPKQMGKAERWWSLEVPYPHTIPVPGVWQAHGFGEPGRFVAGADWRVRLGAIARHNYQGTAWYRRTFCVPNEWAGKRIWLRFEGVCNHGEVYLNDAAIGEVETFITPYEYDVTDHIAFGKENALACRVDSRSATEDPLFPDAKNASSYVGMLQFLIPVGGITSHVIVEARSDPRIDEVVLAPKLADGKVEVRLRLDRQKTGKAWQGEATIRMCPVIQPHPSATARTPIGFTADAKQSETAMVVVDVPDLHPWSPEDPFLYLVDLVLTDVSGTVDAQTIRTGFREFKATPEGNFVLNGKPYYLRGVGYDSLEPLSGAPVPDKRIYAERLRLLKQYGFNYVRFLAHCPHKEFFEAADEEGMFLQPEGEYFNGGLPMTAPTGRLLTAQVPRIIREFRHHPSWYAFSCLNEAFGGEGDSVKQAYFQAAFKCFREMDPTRFFLASEGGGDHWPTDIISDRAVMDKADVPDGSRPATSRQVFHGLLDEVALFGQAISEQSMRTLATAASEPAKYRHAVLAMKPLAYWQLEEQEPGEVRDSSERQCHVQYDPGTHRSCSGRPGKFGLALACGSGSESVAGLSMTTGAETILPDMEKSFSLSLWVKPERFAMHDFGIFFSCGAAETNRAILVGLDGSDDRGRVLIGRYMNDILRSAHSLQADQWNHVGLTWDGKRLCLFLNGERDAEVDSQFTCTPRELALGRLIELTSRSAADYRSRPHVWHEFNNQYLAPLPDLDIEKRLTGAMTQGWVLEPHRRRLESYGLLSRYPELRKLSIRLYSNYVKQAFESARRMPRLDGYAWWVASDIPGGVECDVTSYGILDMLYQPEKFTFTQIQQFNRESVLTMDATIDDRILRSDESRTIRIALSHYGDQPVRDGQLHWKVITGTTTLSQGVIQSVNADCGAITELGSIRLGPFPNLAAAEIRLEVAVVSAACQQSNAWSFWSFPKRREGIPRSALCNMTGSSAIDARFGDAAGASPTDASVILATRLTPDLLKCLEAGGRVLLLQEGDDQKNNGFLQHPGMLTYWALWLKCNANVVESHPALEAFPHEGFPDYQLMRLYRSATPAVDFTPTKSIARAKMLPIIWSLQLAPWSEEATPFNTALTWKGVLTECRIGKGAAMLCTLYVLDGLNRGLPEAGYFLDCLVDYMLSERFAPDVPPLSSEETRQFFNVNAG